MIADLLTLAGLVPLEQRKGVDPVINRAKGMYYGAYGGDLLNMSSYGGLNTAYHNKRDSSTAISGKRKKDKNSGAFTDTLS